jgi:methyl-accepting chemotaxis protein
MRRFGLTAKITLLFALFGIAAALGLASAVRGLEAVHRIDADAIAGQRLANSAALLSSRVAQASLLSRLPAEAGDREIARTIDELDGAIALVESARASLISALPARLHQDNAALNAHIGTFLAFQAGIVDIGRRVSPKAALIEAEASAARENVRQIIGITGALRDSFDQSARRAAADAEILAADVRRRVQLIAIGLPLAGALLAIILLRVHLTRPLRQLMQTIERVSSTDAVVEVPHRKRRDEIGELARTVRALSEVRAQLSSREAQAALAETHRQRRTEELHRIAETFESRIGRLLAEIATVSEGLRAALDDAAVQAEQISQSSGSAAGAVTHAGAEAERISDAAVRLEDVVDQISREIGRVSETAALATRDATAAVGLVGRLTENAGQIRGVVELIDAVARQTNLLALNATIEAARAGAHGRGFAVVAGEVKALAAQTGDATGQIARRIAAVEAALSQAATGISDIVGRVEAVEQASTEIATMVGSHSRLLQSLGETIARISEVTGEAVGAMSTIADANVLSVQRAAQGASGARGLDERITALRSEADEFARRLRAA